MRAYIHIPAYMLAYNHTYIPTYLHACMYTIARQCGIIQYNTIRYVQHNEMITIHTTQLNCHTILDHACIHQHIHQSILPPIHPFIHTYIHTHVHSTYVHTKINYSTMQYNTIQSRYELNDIWLLYIQLHCTFHCIALGRFWFGSCVQAVQDMDVKTTSMCKSV